MPTEIEWDGSTDGDLDTVANYTPAQKPVTGDEFRFRANAVDVDTNLAALTAVRVAELLIDKSYTGLLGLDASPVEIGWDRCEIGRAFGTGSPAGSKRVHLKNTNDGSYAPVTVVHGTANSAEDDYKMPCRLWIAHASAELYVLGGKVAVNDGRGQTGAVPTIGVSGQGSEIYLADGVTTLTSLTMDEGKATLDCDSTAIEARNAEVVLLGKTAHTAITMTGGRLVGSNVPDAGHAITTLTLNGGVGDFLGLHDERTINTVNLRNGAELRYDPDILTINTLIYDSSVRLIAM